MAGSTCEAHILCTNLALGFISRPSKTGKLAGTMYEDLAFHVDNG
jgi:hypothetical protein